MIPRAQALDALSDEFDVVVVGGGITGAGVALDAATRGYSVALVERADFAAGTSSRSSKLVHGGLRYLQNFDLGLVREALLERQLMVALAPHLVHPLPLVVPAFDGARPDRLVGVGLNLYDVMSVDRERRARGRRVAHAARRAARPSGRERASRADGARGRRVLEPRAPPHDLRRGGARAAARAGRARADERLPVLRLPDRRRAPGADRARRGRALRRGVRQPARRRRPARATTGARAASGRATSRAARSSTCGAENVVNATGVWADELRPQELHDEAELPVIRPSRGTHIMLAPRGPAARRRRDRAGRRRAHDLRAALARAHARRHDRQRLRGRPRPRRARPARTSTTCSTRSTSSSARRSAPGDLAGAYAGVRPLISTGDPKKSVDISRKAELYETSAG